MNIYTYTNKKVSKSNNHKHKNVTTVLFCYQNDLNIKANESSFIAAHGIFAAGRAFMSTQEKKIFRHRDLYTLSLSLSLKLVIANSSRTLAPQPQN